MTDIYFKLFPSIKQLDEIELAKLEILSLLGEDVLLEPVKSSVDLLHHSDFSFFLDTYPEDIPNAKEDNLTFQRYIEYQTAYHIQGFLLRNYSGKSIDNFVRRLAYTREVFCHLKGVQKRREVERTFPRGKNGVNMILFKSSNGVAIRAISDQYYWEATEYISKISTSFSDLKLLDIFVERLKGNLVTGINRIPASTKARVGKRFLDYLAERQEPSQYLFHGLHPYKGKFHPKLARAFLNIVYPNSDGIVMDNFSGSGTLLIEAAFLGIDSIGIDINPISVLMGNARLACFHTSVEDFSRAASRITKKLRSEIEYMKTLDSDQRVLASSKHVPNKSAVESAKGLCGNNEKNSLSHINTLRTILTLSSIIRKSRTKKALRELLTLALAIVISRAKRLKNIDVLQEFSRTIDDILRRQYLFFKLGEVLDLTPGTGEVVAADTSNLGDLDIKSKIDAIVNSPPYSTALDYIRNDLEQLVLLGFVKDREDLDKLDASMGGNPRFLHKADQVDSEIGRNSADLPRYAIDVVRILQVHGREDQARRLYKFYELMIAALAQMKQALKPNSLTAVVIGNNLFKLTEDPRIVDGHLQFDGSRRRIRYVHLENNVKSINKIVVEKEEIPQYYGDEIPLTLSEIKNSTRMSHEGTYFEIENDRVIANIAANLGFELEMLVYRYLEKTRRGDVRWETVVVMRNPAELVK